MAEPVEISGVKGVIAFVDPKKMRKVERSTVNRTATALKKESIKESGNTFNLQRKRIRKGTDGKDNIRVKRMGQYDDEAIVTFRGKRPGLQHFSPNKQMINKKKSPKVRIKKGESLRPVERGFFLKKSGTSSNVSGLFTRKGKSSLPIIRRTGPSVKQMYEDRDVMITVEGRMPRYQQKFFQEAFDKQFKGKK